MCKKSRSIRDYTHKSLAGTLGYIFISEILFTMPSGNDILMPRADAISRYLGGCEKEIHKDYRFSSSKDRNLSFGHPG